MSSYFGVSSENLATSFNSAVQNCSLYNLSNMHYALQLDGQQSYGISFIASERIAILCNQVASISPAWISTVAKIVSLGGVFCAIGRFVLFELKGGVNEADSKLRDVAWNDVSDDFNEVTSGLWWAEKVENALIIVEQGFQNSDKLINVASLVSYVALCVLGHPIEGVSGLIGLGLVTLKRHAQLPATIDRYLQPIVNLAKVIYGFTQSTFILFRIVAVFNGLERVYSLLPSSELGRSILPAKIINPLHGLHCYERLTQSYQELIVAQRRKWIADSGLGAERFSIIPTYVHADRVNEVLPPDYLSQMDDVDINQIFNDLDAAIERLKTDTQEWRKDTETCQWQTWAQVWETAQTSPSEGGGVVYKSGYEMLKIAATSGKVADVLPPDVGLFQKVIKALAHSILHDEENLKAKLIDFERIGKQCAERWTSEVQFLLSPNTKDLGWAVHNELAKLRGSILQGVIHDFGQGKITTGDYYIDAQLSNPDDKTLKFLGALKPLMALTGGVNGTHVLNSFHDAFRPIFRTYEGEVNAQLHPYNLLGSLFQRFFALNEYIPKAIDFLKDPEKDPGGYILSYFYATIIGMQAASSHPASAQLSILPFAIYPALQAHFDEPERLVEHIYDAIYPQLVFDEKSGKFEERRKIQWESVQTWMNNFVTNLSASEDENLDPAVDFHDHYFEDIELGGNVEIKGSGKIVPTLTLEGVRLMLWDMGILKRHPKDQSLEYLYITNGRPQAR